MIGFCCKFYTFFQRQKFFKIWLKFNNVKTDFFFDLLVQTNACKIYTTPLSELRKHLIITALRVRLRAVELTSSASSFVSRQLYLLRHRVTSLQLNELQRAVDILFSSLAATKNYEMRPLIRYRGVCYYKVQRLESPLAVMSYMNAHNNA